MDDSTHGQAGDAAAVETRAALTAAQLDDVNEVAATLVPSDPCSVGATFSRTDWGNAQRLALYEGHGLRYVSDLGRDGTWRTWAETRWRRATNGDLVAAAARTALQVDKEVRHLDDADERARHIAHAQSSLSARSLLAMPKVGAGHGDLRADFAVWDADPRWFNCRNLTLDPLTLATHDHARHDLITQVCPTDYVPDATSWRLDEFLKLALPDPAEREYVLQVLASSSLRRGNPARRLVLLLGPTTTGKSTLVDLALRTVGRDYAASVNPSVFRGNLDDKPRPDLLRVLPTRLAVAFEADEHWELHADVIKRMTGGDDIVARAMRSDDMVEQVAAFTPWIVANEAPKIKGADAALRQRLVVLGMFETLDEDGGAKRDALVTDDEARRALLALLVRTYHECGGEVVAEMPGRFADLTMKVFTELDDVAEFLAQVEARGWSARAPEGTLKSHLITTTELFKLYRHAVKSDGTPQQVREMLGPKQFTQRLKTLGYEVPDERTGGSRRVLGWCVGSTAGAILWAG